MRDTLPDAELVRRDAVRRLDPRERLRQALELSDTLRRLRSADRVERPWIPTLDVGAQWEAAKRQV